MTNIFKVAANKYMEAATKHEIKTQKRFKEELENRTHLTTLKDAGLVALGLSVSPVSKKTVALATIAMAALGTANTLQKEKGIKGIEASINKLEEKLK